MEPDHVVSELARVTRPGGRILVHTVNSRHYLAWIAKLTPHRFHQWAVRVTEGREGQDVYPTQYRANTTAEVQALFQKHGCRYGRGGEIADIPQFVPYPPLFRAVLGFGLLERKIAQRPGLKRFLASNLLIEFERVG